MHVTLSIQAILSSHVLTTRERERERTAVNMQGTVFTLAGFEIVHTIKNLIIYDFFMILKSDAVENCIFLRNS